MKKAIVHCSDSEYGNAVIIDSWHRARGFDNIGYHFVILNGKIYSSKQELPFMDGRIETGRSIEKNGAHCKGHNDSIGICLIGKSGDFTENQVLALKNLLFDLSKRIGKFELFQHSDFDDNKLFCAGFTENGMKEIKKFVVEE